MTTPKHNKFSKGKTSGFFPFNQWRFITDNHPVITSKEKCSSKTAKAIFSTQELQMLDGLANMFQCDEREAIRIALYEASRSASEAYELAFRFVLIPKQQIKRIRDDPRRSNGIYLNQKKTKHLKLLKKSELQMRNLPA